MIFARALTATLVASLFLLPACGPQYKKPALTSFDHLQIVQTKNDISVSAHHLTRAQIHQTFGTRGRKLGYYGLCPIQLSIKNHGSQPLIFDPALCTIENANHADVAACLQNRIVLTTASLVGIGLLATGAVYLATLPFVIWYHLTGLGTLMYIGFGAATGMLILTPSIAVYYAKTAHNQNKVIYEDIKDLAVTHERIIPAGQELEVILFTKKKNCKKDFEVSLIYEATQEKTTFDITF